jgi:hypothetical protein
MVPPSGTKPIPTIARLASKPWFFSTRSNKNLVLQLQRKNLFSKKIFNRKYSLLFGKLEKRRNT